MMCTEHPHRCLGVIWTISITHVVHEESASITNTKSLAATPNHAAITEQSFITQDDDSNSNTSFEIVIKYVN